MGDDGSWWCPRTRIDEQVGPAGQPAVARFPATAAAARAMAASSTVQWIAEKSPKQVSEPRSRPEGRGQVGCPDPPDRPGETDQAPEPARRQEAEADGPRFDGPLKDAAHRGVAGTVAGLVVGVDRREGPQPRAHDREVAEDRERLGPGRPRSRPSRASEGGPEPRVPRAEGVAGGDPPPEHPRSRTVAASPVLRSPDDHVPATPARASPTANGTLGTRPARTPTRKVPAPIRPSIRTTRLPLPRVAEPGQEPVAEPRGASIWSISPKASGRARLPRARNAPGPPIRLPIRNGRPTRLAASAGRPGPASPTGAEGRLARGVHGVVEGRGPGPAPAPGVIGP